MKNSVLNQTELFECLNVATLELILKDLQYEIQHSSGKMVMKISNQIFIVEKAIRLKNAQVSLLDTL